VTYFRCSSSSCTKDKLEMTICGLRNMRARSSIGKMDSGNQKFATGGVQEARIISHAKRGIPL